MNLDRIWRWISGQPRPVLGDPRDDEPGDTFSLTEYGLFGTGTFLRLFDSRAVAEEARNEYRNPDDLYIRRFRKKP